MSTKSRVLRQPITFTSNNDLIFWWVIISDCVDCVTSHLTICARIVEYFSRIILTEPSWSRPLTKNLIKACEVKAWSPRRRRWCVTSLRVICSTRPRVAAAGLFQNLLHSPRTPASTAVSWCRSTMLIMVVTILNLASELILYYRSICCPHNLWFVDDRSWSTSL